jgi:hypothetical protein
VTGGLAPGAAVRVKALFPPGHVRTPYFLRVQRGVVLERLGQFQDPEALAYGRRGALRSLYRVRFEQSALWSDYAGAAGDALVADLYDHWLEPLGGEAA